MEPRSRSNSFLMSATHAGILQPSAHFPMLASVASRHLFSTAATHAAPFTSDLSLLARGAAYLDFHAVLVSWKILFIIFLSFLIIYLVYKDTEWFQHIVWTQKSVTMIPMEAECRTFVCRSKPRLILTDTQIHQFTGTGQIVVPLCFWNASTNEYQYLYVSLICRMKSFHVWPIAQVFTDIFLLLCRRCWYHSRLSLES